jgi:general secretion pathway protein J
MRGRNCGRPWSAAPWLGRGFTLVEMLAAMAVLAVLAAVGLRGLSSILESEARVRAETRRWNDVALVMTQVGRDLALAVARPAHDGAGNARAALIVGGIQDGIHSQLELTRLGDDDNGPWQGEPRRVGYRLRERTLEYVVWPVLDDAPGTQPAVSPVLEGVTDLRLRTLDEDGAWASVWPAGGAPAAQPRGVELQLTLEGGARIRRFFALR